MIAHDPAIDHPHAAELAAAALDGFITPAEDAVLDAHLRSCAACRERSAAIGIDARALRALDFGDAPPSTRARVSVEAGKTLGRSSGPGRGVALAAAAVLLLAALTASMLGGVGGRPGTPGESGNPAVISEAPPIVLRTDVVTLAAEELWVDVASKRFLGAVAAAVTSDPGSATYRTLELTWSEHGVEMRINLYFGGDAGSWWVDEVRTYNGAARGDWLYARGRFFQSPLGTPWTGDVDVALEDHSGAGGTPASLHIGGAVLAVNPFDGINEPVGGGITLRAGQQLFEVGAPLHCAGIGQLHPRDAERVLLALGYRLSWRLITDVRGNGSYWHTRREAPDGYMRIGTYGTMVGTEGELIIPVIAPGEPGAGPEPPPFDCPPSTPSS
jgi:hypothetical protein